MQDLKFELLKSLKNSLLFVVVCLFRRYIIQNISAALGTKKLQAILVKEALY
jgi:hypothetical protein